MANTINKYMRPITEGRKKFRGALSNLRKRLDDMSPDYDIPATETLDASALNPTAASINAQAQADALNAATNADATTGTGLPGFWNKVKGYGGTALNYVKANPYKSIALGGLGAANIGGLFDNNEVGGQLIGGAAGAGLGYALPKMLGKAVPMEYRIMAGLGGGALGALFDNLRNKQKRQIAQLYAQNR